MKKLIFIGILAYLLAFRTTYDYGICLNENGDGMLYNGEPYYNYISYSGTKAKVNDEVITICILNPLTTYTDDIVARFDFIRR